jgi:hypothetical protein
MLSLTLATCAFVAACAGGSGSSGFDLTEGAAIKLALDEQRCVDLDGFLVCPADTSSTEPPAVTPTPTGTKPGATENPTPSPTRAGGETPPPTAIPIVTASATPSPTPTVAVAPEVDLVLNRLGAVDCLDLEQDGLCHLMIAFAPEGFPTNAVFRVAVRKLDPITLEPEGAWVLGAPPVPSGSPDMPSFDASVSAVPTADVTSGTVMVQFAVLVFLDPPATIPEQTELLGDTGADYAFITTEIVIEAGTYPL